MSLVINSNLASLSAQRNLQGSQNQLATSLQRLSTGLRVNSAKDDAAGLVIGERFTTQIRGINQAIRNANDGISLVQLGEGALQTVTDNLQRIRELAVQSANGTNSDANRSVLQLEVQQRLDEINRVANQTNFNGRNILDGSFGPAVFQVGSSASDTVALSLGTSMQTNAIDARATATTVDLNTLIAPAPADPVRTLELGANALTFQFGDGDAVSVAAGTYSTVGAFVDAVNTALGSQGTATLNEDGTLSISGRGDLTITATTADAQSLFAATTDANPVVVAATGALEGLSIASQGGATAALGQIDRALDAVGELRSTFGAIQNRFESVIDNLRIASENLSASRSRIMDADFATETANLTRGQILQQAAISVLSQANVQPQSALALLQ